MASPDEQFFKNKFYADLEKELENSIENIKHIYDKNQKKDKLKIKFKILTKISKKENLNLEYLVSKYLKGWKLNDLKNRLIPINKDIKINIESKDKNSDNKTSKTSKNKTKEEPNKQELILSEYYIDGKKFWIDDNKIENKIYDSEYEEIGKIMNGKVLFHE